MMLDTIGKRIWVGFGVILLLLSILGGISFYAINRMGYLDKANKIVQENAALLHEAERDHLAWLNELSSLFLKKEVGRLNIQTDDHQCKFGKWLYGPKAEEMARIDPEIARLLGKIKQPHQELHSSAKQIENLYIKFDYKIDALLAERWIEHLRWANELRDYLVSGKRFTGSINPQQCAFGQWYATFQTEDPKLNSLFGKWASPHETVHNSARKIIEAYESGDRSKAMSIYEQETLPALNQLSLCYQETMDYIDQIVDKNNQAIQVFQDLTQQNAEQVLGYLTQIEGILEKHQKSFQNQYDSFSSFIHKFMPITALLTLTIGGLIAFLLSQNIIGPLRRIISTLSNGAQQVYSASEQISSSSQQLAEGASQQAASLQETSTSLEEITSMTKNNADHAHQANQLMQETRNVVEEASQSMKAMDQSMSELSTSSEEIGKIIKTIDEIAFQTNLLALNAAVEAARAGEAGKGFAVVADEVRNLAQRAAEAARNTSSMIEDAVHKINEGSNLAKRTFEAFEKVAASADKVAGLVSEIAAASKEQAQGIDQVNIAISQMDKVTQQTAASAAQGAASAEKLHLQSESLKAMVADLTRVVGASSKGQEIILAVDQTSTARLPRIAGVERGMVDRRAKSQATPKGGRVVKPEQIIPLDDNDFTDFNG